MASFKNKPLLNQFMQNKNCTVSMLWRCKSSFRKGITKFQFSSPVNISRHQLVKARPAPITPDDLEQMQSHKYMTPKLTKRKSRKYIPFPSDNSQNLDQLKEHKPLLPNTEQLRSLMFDSDSDESSMNLRTMVPNFQSKRSKSAKQQHESKFHLNQRQYREQQDSQKKESRSKLQKQYPKEKSVTTMTKPPPPPKEQPKIKHQQSEDKLVKKQSLKDVTKNFKIQHENMQKIKERDRQLKDQIEQLKVFAQMNRLLKLQHEQEEKEIQPYKVPLRTRDSDYNLNQLQSSRRHSNLATEQLRPLNTLKRAYPIRSKQPVEFAPYTPTNDQSDNADVFTKQHYKPPSKLSPVAEYHLKKAAAMEARWKSQVDSQESAIYKLCKGLDLQHKTKF